MTPAENRPNGKRGFGFPLVAIGILCLVAIIYWPLHQASFVWDDKILIHDNAWLSVGSGWRSIVFHGIADWKYFRPLGLALFVAEIRLFGVVAEPMHLLSLTLHLINTSLVGALAWRLDPPEGSPARAKQWACLAMLLYGLHPALIEPISWLACQFDLLLVLFMLLGLLANATVQRRWLRAVLVTACFSLAACAKETAAAFPILLLLLDWIRTDDSTVVSGPLERFSTLGRRQWPVYLGVFVAGIAYLVIRHIAKATTGSPPEFESWLPWERFQTICFTYMAYWRMIACPFFGLSSAHVVPIGQFAIASPASVATDFAALSVGCGGLLLAWRRRPLGIAIVGATAILFPVLHIVPIFWDDSLYHDRYAIAAVAWFCVLFPRILVTTTIPADYRRFAAGAFVAGVACWVVLAAITIRTMVPTWFSNDRLWEWAMQTNPGAPFVMGSLMDEYINEGNLAAAERIAKALPPEASACLPCQMDIANLALNEHDPERAAKALKVADILFSRGASATHISIAAYVLFNGQVHQLEHDLAGAEVAYRDAISIDPMRPNLHIQMAMLLATEGRAEEARKEYRTAVALAPPDMLEDYRRHFDAMMAQGAKPQAHH